MPNTAQTVQTNCAVPLNNTNATEPHRTLVIQLKNKADWLINVCGMTLIERSILCAHYAGMHEVLLCGPVQDEKLTEYLNKRQWPISTRWTNNEGDMLNNAIRLNRPAVITIEYIRKQLDPAYRSQRIVYVPIDSPVDLKRAEYLLLQSCRKPGESISSHYYRYISLMISKYLCRTAISPNQISYLFAGVSFVGALFIAFSDNWLYYFGLLLQPFAIILDCCDGEVARLRYKFTKSGEWIDTICDNLCSLFFIVSIAIVNYRWYSTSLDLYLGAIATLAYMIAICLLLFALRQCETTGSLNIFNRQFKKKGKFAVFVALLIKRNTTTLIFVTLGILQWTRVLLGLAIFGSFGLIVYALGKLQEGRRIH